LTYENNYFSIKSEMFLKVSYGVDELINKFINK